VHCTSIAAQSNSAIATATIQGYLSPMINNDSTFIESFQPQWCEPGAEPEWLTAMDGHLRLDP
jgi:hypothetical protein